MTRVTTDVIDIPTKPFCDKQQLSSSHHISIALNIWSSLVHLALLYCWMEYSISVHYIWNAKLVHMQRNGGLGTSHQWYKKCWGFRVYTCQPQYELTHADHQSYLKEDHTLNLLALCTSLPPSPSLSVPVPVPVPVPIPIPLLVLV